MRYGASAASGQARRLPIEDPDMKIDFKILKMMELRSSPGEVLDRVARDGEVFVIERNGQPKACLVPVSFLLPDVPPDRVARELDKLNERHEDYRLTITDSKELEISCKEQIAGEDIVISMVMPHGYPDVAPRIYALQIPEDTPQRWQDGSLRIFGATTTWNSKSHDVIFTLGLARTWLKQYAKWRKTAEWPESEEPK
jgi:prevent-host-death family protein